MNSDDLVRMANQIAQFHAAYPREQAVAGVCEHLRKFWTPEMRCALAKARDQPELDSLVNAALQQLRRD